ncbi:MAG: glycosyltransferase [Methanosphaera sp.]|nr:glycosyltransferase [Methanosphaera sp.]
MDDYNENLKLDSFLNKDDSNQKEVNKRQNSDNSIDFTEDKSFDEGNKTVDLDKNISDDNLIYEIANSEISSLKDVDDAKELTININDEPTIKSLNERIPKVYIVSKNKKAIRNIEKTLTNEHYDLVGISDNSEEALYFIEENLPDIVFLSLDINGKKNGEELGKLINKLDIPIIYIFNIEDNLTQSNFIETNYGFIFDEYSTNEIKFVIKVALKKHTSNVKTVIDVKSRMTKKNIELGIEKLYSGLLLVLSIILIISGIIAKNVTFLQWIIFIPSVMMIFLAVISLFKMEEPKPYDKPPFVSIIIPAHNEQYTIEDTVRSIVNMDYTYNGKPNYELIVVNDGSDDKTGEILSDLKKEYPHLRIITRKPPKSGKGKGFVLNDALALSYGSILGVFDADTWVKPDFLTKLIPYLNNPKVQGVQCRVRMYNKDYNFLTNMQDVEFSGFGNILRAKDNLKFNGFLGGNGQFVKKDAIIKAGKWDGFAVTEDLNLSVKLLISGGEIRYCPEVSVYQEAVDNWHDFMKQRVRWAMGNFETLFVYFSRILTCKLPFYKKVGIIFHISNYAFNLFIFIGFLIFIINIIGWFVLHIPTVIRMEAPLIIGIISAVGFFPGISIALIRDDKKYLKFIKDLIEYWIYCFHLIPLFFITMWDMITRVERRWAKTTHKGIENEENKNQRLEGKNEKEGYVN